MSEKDEDIWKCQKCGGEMETLKPDGAPNTTGYFGYCSVGRCTKCGHEDPTIPHRKRYSLLHGGWGMNCVGCADYPNQRLGRHFALQDVQIELVHSEWRAPWYPDGETASVHVRYFNVILSLKCESCNNVVNVKLPWKSES